MNLLPLHYAQTVSDPISEQLPTTHCRQLPILKFTVIVVATSVASPFNL